MNHFPPPGSLYAVYARYSTDHQTFKSIEDQLTLCRAYAARHGWIEAGAYHDAARSGATVIGRAGLFDMLAAADRGEFSIILVEDLDRLSRSASGAGCAGCRSRRRGCRRSRRASRGRRAGRECCRR